MNTMAKILHLHCARYSLCLAIIAWCCMGSTTTLYCQIPRNKDSVVRTQPQLLSLQCGIGTVLGRGFSPVDFTGSKDIFRTVYADVEFGARLPIKGQVFDMLYGGVQATVYAAEQYQETSLRRSAVAHIGIEADFLGVRGRTTIGLGILSGALRDEQTKTYNDANDFAFTIRQVLWQNMGGNFDMGLQAEQTFSRYDSFFRLGVVGLVRW